MKILAIDTSTGNCSIALEYAPGQRLQHHSLQAKNHGQLILPFIQQLMDEAGIKFQDLDALTFGRGPGSFTGLRISASVVQAISWAHDLPIIPISSLLILAQNAYIQTGLTQVFVCVDAKMQAYYFSYAKVNQQNLMEEVVAESYVKHEDLLTLLSPQGANQNISNIFLQQQKIAGVGDGWLHLEPQNLSNIHIIQDCSAYANYLLDYAVSNAYAGKTIQADAALPVYLSEIQYKLAE